MNRRFLFRSLGLAAVVAGVSALPKAPKIDPVIPEGLPAFTQAKSEPLPEIHPIVGAIDWTGDIPRRWDGVIWRDCPLAQPLNGYLASPYPLMSGGAWTTTGTNQLTFTNSATLRITAGAANPTTGYVQVVSQA